MGGWPVVATLMRGGTGRRSSRLAPHGEVDRTLADACKRIAASTAGLSSEEAARRLALYGPNRLREEDGHHPMAVLWRQFRSPMVLILLGAAILSAFLGETEEAAMVVVIVLASTGLGFYQEYRADNAVAELRRRMAVSSRVRRDGRDDIDVPSVELVPGDVVLLHAGSLVPADAILLSAAALHLDEAALTGESFPVVKSAATPELALSPANRVHMGTSVRSGEGRALVVETGVRTEFGSLAASVAALEAETSFALGIRRFGLLMTQIMFVLVTVVLVANVLLGRPVLDSLLFAAALAVGITPELLPAIVTVTLSRGAAMLTARGVLVRRLVAIEDLGAMDVLCTDKTGTLTVGDVTLERAVDVDGRVSAEVMRWGVLNASLQTALPNPLDTAILAHREEVDLSGCTKLGEIPYDFERKRLSVVVGEGRTRTLACKGAAASVLEVCGAIKVDGVAQALTPARLELERRRLAEWSGDGRRVIALAVRSVGLDSKGGAEDEADLTLLGYLLFSDPLKAGIAQTVSDLSSNGIGLRIISGDNRYVAEHVASAIGLAPRLITGPDLNGLGDEAFARRIADINVFAEVTPDQKERIIVALRRTGRTVGYLGDGINDAPALRAADVGISVDNAVDAAKASADVILLKQDLEVLLDGILAGRTAFGNTIKYIAITLSSNFGNMISMAAASLFLPFLLMLAGQILLNNLLADLPMFAVSTDRVDSELLGKPRQWDFRSLVRSMLGFGLVSSAFDAVTFLVLLQVFYAAPATFQTAWFTESLLTELAVVAVMRTQKPFFRSLPSKLLMSTAIGVALLAVVIPFLPVASLFSFVPLSIALVGAIFAIVIAYMAASELLKRRLAIMGPAATSAAAN